MLENVELEKARELILSRVTLLPGETVPLLQALGCVISEDIYADHDLPQYPQAAVDGYAVPAEGGSDHTRFEVKERLLPGETPRSEIGPGQTVAVVTGGPLPAGAAAVIPQEAAEPEGEYITFRGKIPPGGNIKVQGEDFHAGDRFARQGTVLNPGLAGVLAAYGKTEVDVFRRPRVAILGLGPDIVSCSETPRPGQMRDSNGLLLAALVTRDGGRVTSVELAGAESSTEIRQRLEKLLQMSDLVLTTGGTAYGVGDQAVSVFKQSGADLLYWGLKVKPGGHGSAAVRENKLIISLSGNPSACAVGYYLLAVPVLRALQGLDPGQVRLAAVCADAFPKRGGPRRFLQAVAFCGQAGWEATILPGQKSSMMRALTRDCNALIDLPAGHPPVERGAKVSIILLKPALIGK
ncbi:molybdopterin molybdotransferase MoeA [Pelotomaculum terephthalicicum JT]|uniref:molybdopterin molybdotransferase MoeA n=1 Tax=Pelotomaculum terephthalicicum TaxID=206393 RepID=UPI0009CC3AA2|nr:molybdopterin molybdotransferase MoeA [Pelotomaculum terephthalicicum]MCG9966606.1 molybdopterin molybdotransferase MoeA [Pelotomaculum terephthalicicum JT]OPY63545.1 MAG: Molybdopterin molybdenumtransferase [Pelotomaculum sp. PtaU1.Bin065]